MCDEPLSALDVSIQVQIMKLLQDLQREMNLAYLFISHNLGVVQYLSDTVMVLYLGEVVEQAPAEDLFRAPAHPYTRMLLESILKVPDSEEERRRMTMVPGEMPSPFAPRFACPAPSPPLRTSWRTRISRPATPASPPATPTTPPASSLRRPTPSVTQPHISRWT